VEVLADLSSADNAEFVLLVPATDICNAWVCDEIEAVRVARVRAADASDRLKRSGLNVIASRIGDADPIDAMLDELQSHDGYDAIVVSTLPPGVSRWLRMDVPARAQRLVKGRRLITVVAGVPSPIAMGRR
jgi:hypothetical protein